MKGSSDRGYQEAARSRKARAVITFLPAVLLLFGNDGGSQPDTGWTRIGAVKEMNISGLARLERPRGASRMLVVHDNKHPGERRLAIISVGGPASYRTLAWPDGYAWPVDLEAVSPVPGHLGVFMTVTSGGTASLLHLDGERVTLRGAFTLPDRPAIPNIEGLSVQRVGNVVVAAWGHRGAGTEAGLVFWGRLDFQTPSITSVQKVELRVPFPSTSDPNTRHISDMRIAGDGRLWIAAASDPSNAGPFVSAVYEVGRFKLDGDAIRLTHRASLSPIAVFPRKIEALELIHEDTQLVLGTDDERTGSAVRVIPLPGDPANAAAGPGRAPRVQ